MAGNHKHIGEFDLSFSFWWVYKSWFGSWKLSWCDMTWKRLESYYLHLSTFQLLETSQNSGVLGDSLWFIPGDPQVVPTSELGWGNSDVFWANLLWHFKVGKKASPIHQIPRDYLVGSWERWNLIIFWWNLGWNLVIFDENCWNPPNSKRNVCQHFPIKKMLDPPRVYISSDFGGVSCRGSIPRAFSGFLSKYPH